MVNKEYVAAANAANKEADVGDAVEDKEADEEDVVDMKADEEDVVDMKVDEEDAEEDAEDTMDWIDCRRTYLVLLVVASYLCF